MYKQCACPGCFETVIGDPDEVTFCDECAEAGCPDRWLVSEDGEEHFDNERYRKDLEQDRAGDCKVEKCECGGTGECYCEEE